MTIYRNEEIGRIDGWVLVAGLADRQLLGAKV